MNIKRKILIIVNTVALCILLCGTAYAAEYAPDKYESNDSIGTAYPYDKMTTFHGDKFSEGYKNATLNTDTDVDYYSISLNYGQQYFVDLRNVAPDSGWMIEIVSESGKPIYRAQQNANWNQEICGYYTSEVSGICYIKVSGNGVASKRGYYMYVGAVNRTAEFTYPAGLLKILSAYGSKLTFDGTSLFPKYAKVQGIWLTKDGLTGDPYYTLKARVKALKTGKYYYNSAAGSENIKIASGAEYAAQKWEISGMCSSGGRSWPWTPDITIRFSYKIGPLPDNSIK